MSKDTQDRLIEAVKLIALIGAAVGAYALGAHELAMAVAGGALGHAMPGRRSVVTP